MDFLVKFAQVHESFRVAEIKALALIDGVDLIIKEYDDDVSLPEKNDQTQTQKGGYLTFIIVSALHRATAVS